MPQNATYILKNLTKKLSVCNAHISFFRYQVSNFRVTAMYPGVSEEEVQSACEAELEFVSRSEMKSMAE